MAKIVLSTLERLAETEARRLETIQQAEAKTARTDGCSKLLFLAILALLSSMIVIGCVVYLF